MEICIKCGSHKVIPEAALLDLGHHSPGYAQVQVQADPGAIFLKEAVNEFVTSKVCGECGYMELYANAPGALWHAYQQQQNNRNEKNFGR